MAAAVSADPDTAQRFRTREELGVDHPDLPCPVVAGAASFAAFSVGALLPLLPYLLGAPRAGGGDGPHRSTHVP